MQVSMLWRYFDKDSLTDFPNLQILTNAGNDRYNRQNTDKSIPHDSTSPA